MNFGYKLSPSSAVDLDKVDFSLYHRIEKIEPDVRICIGCGSCSATCTGQPFSGMSLRKVILSIQRGRENEARQMLSGCMLCGKCTMVCPRGINTRNLIISLCRFWDDDKREYNLNNEVEVKI